jgi:hypothetical protein
MFNGVGNKIKMNMNHGSLQYDRRKLFVVFLLLIGALIDVAISDVTPAAT